MLFLRFYLVYIVFDISIRGLLCLLYDCNRQFLIFCCVFSWNSNSYPIYGLGKQSIKRFYNEHLPQISFVCCIFYMIANRFKHSTGCCHQTTIEYLLTIKNYANTFNTWILSIDLMIWQICHINPNRNKLHAKWNQSNCVLILTNQDRLTDMQSFSAFVIFC